MGRFFSSIRGGEKFDFIIVDIGTNDLCGNVCGADLARDLVSRASDVILHTRTLQHISFNLVVKRLYCRQRSVDEFDFERASFNNELKYLCRNHPQLSYFNCRLDDDAIALWSGDGIHPTSCIGKEKYVAAVRHQIFLIAKLLRKRRLKSVRWSCCPLSLSFPILS